MRVLISAILVFLLITSCDNTLSNVTSEEIESSPEGAAITAYDHDPDLFRATIEEGGRIIEEGDLLNGEKHGSWIEFANDGPVKSITTYLKGIKHGASIKIDRNNIVTEKANYSNGVLDGEFILFSRRRIIEERNYEKGMLQGSLKKYYNSGNIMEESTYKNDKIDGLAKWYDKEGAISFAYLYKDGVLIDENPDLD